MMVLSSRIAASMALAALLAVSMPIFTAQAQTQAQTDAALLDLSEILGALAHLEDICAKGDGSRTDMEALLASEELTPVRQSVLIDSFNRGFRNVAVTHQRCTSASERLIERHHERGGEIISGLLGE
ncbi:MAG: TIGR02301 family protein [Hyphomicrobiales bacterium]